MFLRILIVDLDYFSTRLREASFLSRLRKRFNRDTSGQCVERCHGNDDCGRDEMCIVNGCRHVCAKFPRSVL